MRTPVLIVGAGPVGLTLACELTRYRVPVRTVERSLVWHAVSHHAGKLSEEGGGVERRKHENVLARRLFRDIHETHGPRRRGC
jgi:flavin-dependent dehydrogenase